MENIRRLSLWETSTSNINDGTIGLYWMSQAKKPAKCLMTAAWLSAFSSPTRYSADGQTFSVLDLFVNDQPDLVYEITVTDPISDHCWTTVELNLSFSSPPKQTISYLDNKNADWPGLRSHLLRSNLSTSISGTFSIDIAWTVWKTIITEVVLRHIPSRTLVLRRKNKPFMSSRLHRLRDSAFQTRTFHSTRARMTG